MYIYQQTETNLWTVGYFDPNTQEFIGQSDHESPDLAARRIHYLYGGRVEARYVYLQTGTALWTVGFYDPEGHFHGESDHADPEDAAMRIHYLHGGAQVDYVPNTIEPVNTSGTGSDYAKVNAALAILSTYSQVPEDGQPSVVEEAVRTLTGSMPDETMARCHTDIDDASFYDTGSNSLSERD